MAGVAGRPQATKGRQSDDGLDGGWRSRRYATEDNGSDDWMETKMKQPRKKRRRRGRNGKVDGGQGGRVWCECVKATW